MTMSQNGASLTWGRDTALSPAKAYTAGNGRFTIIWDPEGWHLWDDDDGSQASILVAVFPTLRAAKAAAEERVQ